MSCPTCGGPAATAGTCTSFASSILPGIQPLPPPDGESSFSISEYDAKQIMVDGSVSGEILKEAVGPVTVHALQDGKALIKQACDALGVSPERHALYVAMAMQESTNMDVKQRDATKDFAGNAANFSLFNLSVDMAERSGYLNKGNWAPLSFAEWQTLNSTGLDSVKGAVGILEASIAKWGVPATLAYVRGGYTGWQNPSMPDVIDYQRAIAAFLTYIDGDNTLLQDNRRVNIFVRHI